MPTLMAMLMVLFTTMVPHHHHQAMICLVKEVCELDGCTDDEHTNHSDANHEQDESHCVSRERYCPSDVLRLDVLPVTSIDSSVPAFFPIPSARKAPAASFNGRHHSPPLLSWRINC